MSDPVTRRRRIDRLTVISRAALVLAALAPLTSAPAPAQIAAPERPLDPAVASEIKTSFIYTVAKFVEWPPAADPTGTPMIFTILGEDTYGPALDALLAGKSVRSRPIAIRRVATIEEVGLCDLLVITASERERLPSILDALKGRSILTVSEIEGFARAGGMLELEISEGLIRFQVNEAAVERTGLRISSKILSLGRVVRADRRLDRNLR